MFIFHVKHYFFQEILKDHSLQKKKMQSLHFYYAYFQQTTRFLKFRFWPSPGPPATQCQQRGPVTEDGTKD
jgi:hypothetical protein